MEVENTKPLSEGTLRFKVESDVVSHLSIGLYRNFSRSLKELVSNAYDAGATEIRIGVDFVDRKITIMDNGRGMDLDELQTFIDIGRTTEPDESLDELNRKRIGAFGIGVLSVFPYAETMRVYSKKRGSSTVYELVIKLLDFFSEDHFELTQAEASYTEWPSDIPEKFGETIIVLENVFPHILDDLASPKGGTSSVEHSGGIEKLKWYLAQYCPLAFPPQYSELESYFNTNKEIPIKLFVQGDPIYRNVPHGSRILEKNEKTFGDIQLKYAILSPMEAVRPSESRGLQVRLRSVGIGLPRDFDVSKLTGKVLGKLNYLCGEVHIIKGLENTVMIDRDDFFFTKNVSEMNEFFRRKLIEWNDRLEDWALEDKEVYIYTNQFEDSAIIEHELKEAGLLHLEKARVRIPKKSISKKKNDHVGPLVDKLAEVLQTKSNYTVTRSNNPSSKPLELDKKNKNIVIYEKHEDIREIIHYGDNKYVVNYDNWDFNITPSICKIENNTVFYNKKHPLFKTDLNNEIIKQLSLGIFLITMKEGNENMLAKLENLLIEVFDI